MSRGVVSIGLAGSLGPEAVAEIAPAVEAAGFHTLWINDTPDGDALAALAAAATATRTIRLATGVIPVDRRPAAAIAADVASLGLPLDRLTVGIGSGTAKAGALARVRDAIAVLHDAGIPRVLVGALGPKMRRLGAAEAEGVLLNWVPPTEASAQAEALGSDAYVAVYVRTAIVDAARARLDTETARYASFPNYAANFARMGVDAADTTIRDVTELAGALEAYTAAVDEVVLRAIVPDDTVPAYVDFARRTGPGPMPAGGGVRA